MGILKHIVGYLRYKLYYKNNQYLSHFDYYESLCEQISLKQIERSISDKCINCVNTERKISFNAIEFGTSLKKTIKELGKPRFMMKSQDNANITYMVYRKKFFENKASVLFIYAADKLISGSFIFDIANSNIISDVEELIYHKYFPNSDFRPETICDNNFNSIEINHGVHYKINFYTGDKSVLHLLSKESIASAANKKVELAYSNLYNLF